MMRVQKGFWSRAVNGAGSTAGSENVQCLYAWCIPTGETLEHINLQLDIMSRDELVGTDPNDIAEHELVCLSIPDVLMTRSLTADTGAINRGLNHPTSMAGLTQRFKALLYEPYEDGIDYFGDAEREGVDSQDGDDAQDQGGQENDRYKGPLGVVRHYQHQTWLQTRLIANSNDQRLGEVINMRLNIGRSGPAYVLFGVRRNWWNSTAVQPRWLPNDADPVSWSALNRLYGADLNRNKKAMTDGGDALADRFRELLFQGDPFMVEEGTGMVQPILHYRSLYQAHYDTPYSDMVR